MHHAVQMIPLHVERIQFVLQRLVRVFARQDLVSIRIHVCPGHIYYHRSASRAEIVHHFRDVLLVTATATITIYSRMESVVSVQAPSPTLIPLSLIVSCVMYLYS